MASIGRNRNLLVPGVIALVVFLAVGAYWYAREDFSSLPVYGEVPEFSLIDARGGAVTRQNLMGSVWVVNLIYTRCTDTCPIQTAHLVRFQKEFQAAKDFRLVSISIDPAHDTPAVLKRYAAAHGADLDLWYFLTGKMEAVEKLVTKGLHLPFIRPGQMAVGWMPSPSLLAGLFLPAPAYAHDGPHEKPKGKNLVPHSSRFVLLDRKAQIRGYYHSSELESVEKLRKDLRALLGL
jgi:protein SCO1/2